MPRVVPSQIIDLIDQVLSAIPAAPGGVSVLTPLQAPQLSALLDLVSEMPDEYLVLVGDDYSKYRVGVSGLKALLTLWQNQLPAPAFNRLAVDGVDCLKAIRELLAKCPDEIPSPATTELSFIGDLDLRNSIRNDISAAYRALVDGLWKGATVLAGAAAEALLLWAITERKSAAEIEAAHAAVISSARSDPNWWDLDGYIKVAKALGLIEDETAKQGDLAREFRNLIHPGRAARLAKKCDRGSALGALAAVELIVRDLIERR
jgi:hypothetical protein